MYTSHRMYGGKGDILHSLFILSRTGTADVLCIRFAFIRIINTKLLVNGFNINIKFKGKNISYDISLF